jgi:hypothetical protein
MPGLKGQPVACDSHALVIEHIGKFLELYGFK